MDIVPVLGVALVIVSFIAMFEAANHKSIRKNNKRLYSKLVHSQRVSTLNELLLEYHRTNERICQWEGCPGEVPEEEVGKMFLEFNRAQLALNYHLRTGMFPEESD